MADLQMQMMFWRDISAPLLVQTQVNLLMQGDNEANALVIDLYNKDQTADASGYTVAGYLLRADGAKVPLKGDVNGNRVTVPLNEHCYLVPGPYGAFVRLVKGDFKRTILKVAGEIESEGDGPVVDIDEKLFTVEDVIEQMEAMIQVTEAAQSATAAANAAASSANTAAAKADAAAEAIEGLTVSSENVEPGTDAGVKISTENGKKNIHFKLPQGQTGATPDITFRVATGAPGTQVEVQQSGTSEHPIVDLTIPRGDTGAVDGIDYYAGNPAALGTASPGTANGLARGDHVHPMPTAEQVGARPNTWTPSASDVGALPSSGTAANAEKLGGEPPETYKNKVTAVNGRTGDVSVDYLNGDKSRVNLRNEVGYSGLDFYGRTAEETGLTMKGTLRQNVKDVNSRGFAKLEYLNAANSRIARIYTTEDPPTAKEVGVPVVTPQMYGAKADNATDDTASIQAAINAVHGKGGKVYFPAGSYRISDTLTVTDDGVRLEGECAQAVYIHQANPAKSALLFSGVDGDALSGVSVSQLSMYCDAGSTNTGIRMVHCVNASIENVIITDFRVGTELNYTGNSFVKMVGVATSVPNAIGFRHGNHSVSTQYIDIFVGFLPDAAGSSTSAFWTGTGFYAKEGNIADFTINYLDVGNGYTGIDIDGTDSPASYPPADIRLYDIICDNCHNRGIDIKNIGEFGNVVIDGGWLNLYQNTSVRCINLSYVHNVAVHNVTMQQLLNAAPTQFGITCNNATCVSVRGNRFINIRNGFSCTNPNRWDVSNNIFYIPTENEAGGYAIYMSGAKRTNITGNIIQGNYIAGVKIAGESSKCIVAMNNIEGSAAGVETTDTTGYVGNNLT